MRTVIGLLFIILPLIGCIYFRSYTGGLFQYPAVWFAACVLLVIFGVWLIYSTDKKSLSVAREHLDAELASFKSRAERVKLDVDKCEFRSGSFSYHFGEENLSLSHIGRVETENVVQSYLTYADFINGEQRKFVSHAFPFDKTTLEFYVLNQDIALYIDRFDGSKYLFDMKR